MAFNTLSISDATRKSVSRLFPNLLEHVTFEYTSNVDFNYNCLSWALSVNTYLFENEKWCTWPWPEIPDDTAAGWNQFLQRMRFEPCPDADFVPGFEKIAIYGDKDNGLHACRSDEKGVWKSKLGDMGPDIDHFNLECLQPTYGEIAYLLQRKRPDWSLRRD